MHSFHSILMLKVCKNIELNSLLMYNLNVLISCSNWWVDGLISLLVQQLCKNCAFNDTSMKFGTHIEGTLRNIFGDRAITHFSHSHNGSRFKNGCHLLQFFMKCQVRSRLTCGFLFYFKMNNVMIWYYRN